MTTLNFFLELVEIELALYIANAKLALCETAEDVDAANDAWEIAFKCGVRYETLDEVPQYSDCIKELKIAIRELYFSMPSFLTEAFESGCCDVKISRLGLD